MSQKIVCGNCGGKVKLPPGFAKAKIRCGNCGYYADVPPDQRSTVSADDDGPTLPAPKNAAPSQPPPLRRGASPADPPPLPDAAPRPPKPVKPIQVRPRTDPRDKRPEFVTDGTAGPPLLEGTREEDDNPYTVHGTGLKNCPKCRGELPLDATFCVHCGEHLDPLDRDRPKKKRTYTEIDETFTEGFLLPTRLAIFAAFQVLNVVFTVTALAASSFRIDGTAVVTGVFAGLFNTALQAFIVGSYDALRVQRNAKGRATITRRRRICFIPLPPVKIEWKSRTGVGRYATHTAGVFEWLVCLYLLLCAACLPGVLFWWFVIKPERYNVALTDVYNGIEETVFHSRGQEQAEQVAELIAEATTLQLKSVL
jgi:hypothetical protein